MDGLRRASLYRFCHARRIIVTSNPADAMEELHAAVRDAHAGRRPALTEAELDSFARRIRPDAEASVRIETMNGEPTIVVRAVKRVGASPSSTLAVLSPREREVAQLIAAGLTNAEIAQRLGIRVATVKDHVHRILERLGVRSRQHVVALVVGSSER
jgi:DNA-binding NarL/FixJ family response regulator